MPVDFTYRCALPSGLHARPCSHIAEVANRHSADATLANRRNGRVANAKSVLSLLSADVLVGDECAVTFIGADEVSASTALRAFLENDLAALEEAASVLPSSTKVLPRSLRLANVPAAFGLPLSPGFGQGALLVVSGIRLPELGKCGIPRAQLDEQQKLSDAIARLRLEFEQTASRAVEPALGIVKAHLAILGDVAFAKSISDHIQQGAPAGDAIILTANSFAATLAGSGSAYIRERVIDIQEVSLRLYETIYGDAHVRMPASLHGPTVLVAENLGAQELLQLNRNHVQGIVFGDGQATSHAVILARSLGIPAIAGATEVKRLFANGDAVILDGDRGYVIAASADVQHFYLREREVDALCRKQLRHYADLIGSTADGHRIEVGANVSSPDEAERAFANGCDGIGLFRTEMLFVGRDAPPSEEEQFAAYARAAKAGNGKPIILRTFDAGGDKPVSFLRAPAGSSVLGDRGILIYKENSEVLQTQIRAMLRASAMGKVRIMVPLISTADELLWMKEQLSIAQHALTALAQPFDPAIELGIMIELPTAVPQLGELAGHADFFSIGTNDLTQYFFAEDRTRAKLDLRANVRHPAFLRLLQDIANAAKASPKWLGMCGEMAGDPRNLPLLVGLGLNEISIGGDVLAMKRRLAKLTTSSCTQLLQAAIACTMIEEVDALLATFTSEAPQSLLILDLVIPASQSTSRADAIRELVDVLHLHARTSEPDRLEDALWEREASYPTDMGLGFALPHCKSEAVRHSSIALLRPRQPFLWSAESTVPVRAVIMLAMKDEPGKHMQVLAKLARRLMDEDFRERLIAFPDQDAAVQYLTEEARIT